MLERIATKVRKDLECDIAWAQHEIMLLNPYLHNLKDKKAITFIERRMLELKETIDMSRLVLTTVG